MCVGLCVIAAAAAGTKHCQVLCTVADAVLTLQVWKWGRRKPTSAGSSTGPDSVASRTSSASTRSARSNARIQAPRGATPSSTTTTPNSRSLGSTSSLSSLRGPGPAITALSLHPGSMSPPNSVYYSSKIPTYRASKLPPAAMSPPQDAHEQCVPESADSAVSSSHGRLGDVKTPAVACTDCVQSPPNDIVDSSGAAAAAAHQHCSPPPPAVQVISLSGSMMFWLAHNFICCRAIVRLAVKQPLTFELTHRR